MRRIKECPHQEIGTHTFSHYYCLEDGQTRDFPRRSRSGPAVGSAPRHHLRSLVFPRNQFSADYLGICREIGIEAVRGNQQFWLFRSKGEANETLIKKIGRRLDHYLPLSGYNGVTPEPDGLGIVNIRSSRFLLPVPIRSRLLALCVSTASLPA